MSSKALKTIEHFKQKIEDWLSSVPSDIENFFIFCEKKNSRSFCCPHKFPINSVPKKIEFQDEILIVSIGYDQNEKTKFSREFRVHDFDGNEVVKMSCDNTFELTIPAKSINNNFRSSLNVEGNPLALKLLSQFDELKKTNFLENVSIAQNEMQEGNCYLVNLAEASFLKTYDEENFDAENLLRFIETWFSSQSRFGILFKHKENYGKFFSPEKFLEGRIEFEIPEICQKNESHLTLTCEPIKGTLKIHGKFPTNTELDSLWLSEKEKAEQLMLIELVLSDFSSICQPFSVKAVNAFEIKFWAGLLQMQSTIEGKVKTDSKEEIRNWLKHVISSMLPVASVTGTPKKIASQLISQLEKQNRNVYTGIATLSNQEENSFVSSVLIRGIYKTPICYSVSVAAGITILSKAENEWLELKHKLLSFARYL